jgi:4-aminobutyrate aminotransferase-like enzyme
MIGIATRRPDLAEALQWACFRRGLLVLEAGHDVVRLSPPLVVSEEEVATALEILAAALEEVAALPEPTASGPGGDGGAGG